MAFAGDGVDGRTAGADGRRDAGGGAWISPTRGQAVLVGALRPAQQSRRRVGGHQRRVHRRDGRGRQGLAPAVVTRQKTPALGRAHRRSWRRADSRRRCSRSTTRQRRPGLPTTPTGAPRATPRSSASTTRTVPTEVIDLRARAARTAPFHAAAVRADTSDRPSAPSKLRESIDDRGRRGRRGPARTCPTPRSWTSCCAEPRAPSAARRCPHTGDTTADITAALLDLDSSYLAVHGPPGTGKTFTAARSSRRW